MQIQLRSAMQAFLNGWTLDLPQLWRTALGEVVLDFNAVSPELCLDVWEPIFPVRRGQKFPGMPSDAHLLRAFDGPGPDDVRCVILGQDPYPDPGLATGRAFEAGNITAWRELNRMCSKSIRAYVQMLVAARTGEPCYAGSFNDWPRTLAAIENGDVKLHSPCELADHHEAQGLLLLNSSLTLTRFDVQTDPHQANGHLPLWYPLMKAVLNFLIARRLPLVIIGFGAVAARLIASLGISGGLEGNTVCILRQHPAAADAVLSQPNPFIFCNGFLTEMGESPIEW